MPEQAVAPRSRSRRSRAQKRLLGAGGTLRRPSAILAWGFIALCLIVSLLAPAIAPFDPTKQSSEILLSPGSAPHWLGTDNLGRDQLSRVLYGGRPLIVTSLVAVVVATMAGVVIGLFAGYRKGFTETGLMRSMDALLSFPLVLLGLMIVAGLGTGVRNLIIAIAIAQTPIVARLVHGLVLREASREYVLAARAAGMSHNRIMLHEILPNIIGPVVVQATSMFAIAAGFSTALSYLGLGVQPPEADWGLMVRDGQAYIQSAPDLALIPGILITVLLVAVTFAGDDLRDVLDPDRRLEGGIGK